MRLRKLRVILLMLILLTVPIFSEKPLEVKAIGDLQLEDYKYDNAASIILKFKLSPDDFLSKLKLSKDGILRTSEMLPDGNMVEYGLLPNGTVEIKKDGTTKNVNMTDLESPIRNDLVKFYHIYFKIGQIKEPFNAEEFSEFSNISTIRIAKNIYSYKAKKDLSIINKFRLPYYKTDDNYYYIRFKGLDDLKKSYIEDFENKIKVKKGELTFENKKNTIKKEILKLKEKYINNKKKLKAEKDQDIKKELISLKGEFNEEVGSLKSKLQELKKKKIDKEKKNEIKKEIILLKEELKKAKKDFAITFTVAAESKEGMETYCELFSTITPKVEQINLDKLWIFLFSIGFIIIMLLLYNSAKKGKKLYVRAIAGLSAVEEAVGRATEMGKPVLYISGISYITDIQTLASINILGQIAKKVAIYETPLIVPVNDPIVYTVLREVVREAYVDVGKPDAYQEESVFFLTTAQFAYAAGVNGIIVRDKPSTIFYMGSFFAESLLMSETGNQVGAMQIAGTASTTQIPFFIASCDYTLIGEELFAASAYLSRDPLLLSTIKAQDYGKALIMLLMILGLTLELSGIHWIIYILQNIPD